MSSGELFIAFLFYVSVFTFLIWLPYKLYDIAFKNWLKYIRADFYSKQKYKLLELIIPNGQAKSPLAMEVFLNTLFQPGGEGSWIDLYIKGSTKSWFTLELVSTEGRVHFYIWTKENFVNTIKTQLYAQFPKIEVVEVSDYVTNYHYDDKYKYWCGEFQKKNAGHFPIKTYTDYGLDKDPDEEFKIDPMVPVLEYLGNLSPKENAWIQIAVRAPSKDIVKDLPKEKEAKAKAKKDKKLSWYQNKEYVDWTDAAKDELKKLSKRDLKAEEGKTLSSAELKLTSLEQEKLDAVDRSLSKIAFEVCIRAVYFAEKDNFIPANSAALTGSFKQYNTTHLNSFEVKSPSVKYPWQDMKGIKVDADKKTVFNQYKNRSFFYKEFIPEGALTEWKSNKHKSGKPFIMTSEELATIFHFPGDVAPGVAINRITAKRGEAPLNLPI